VSDDRHVRVYGCNGPDIGRVAEMLASALRIAMYPNRSPMIGPWYSSRDLGPVARAVAGGDPAAAGALLAGSRSDPEVTLQLNDPDPYHGGPSYPGGHTYVVLITGSSSALDGVEASLAGSELGARRLK
jgi:hypothetical protein